MQKIAPRFMIDLLKNILKHHHALVKMSESDDCLLSLVDAEPKSPLYFKILSEEKRDNTVFYHVDFRPADEFTSGAFQGILNKNELEDRVSKWFETLRFFNEPHPLFNPPPVVLDGPITDSYAKELATKFDIADADADTAPFSINIQDAILAKYEAIIALIVSEKTPENAPEAQAIIEEIATAQRQLSKSTKRTAFDTLVKITAYCYKYSFKVGSSIAADILIEIGKRLLV